MTGPHSTGLAAMPSHSSGGVNCPGVTARLAEDGLRPESVIGDMSISELTAEDQEGIAKTNDGDWFRSLGYAGTYSSSPAQRVCFVRDSEKRIVDACFYRELQRFKVFNEIQVQGRVSSESMAVKHLLATRKPALIHLSWLRAEDIQSVGTLGLRFSVQQMADDFLIDLPPSEQEYLDRLGGKTRKHLPYYVRRMEREWGSDVAFSSLVGHEISRELFDRVLELNRKRMERRGKRSGWSSEIVEQRWPLVQEYGLLVGVHHRGTLVASTLSFVHGRDAYLIVLAHEPEFDRLNMGNIVLWMTLKHLIRMRLRCYHLMWGASFYKRQFGGKSEPLFRATAFASPFYAMVWRAGQKLQIPFLFALPRKVWQRIEVVHAHAPQ
jgi:hypothetical protein